MTIPVVWLSLHEGILARGYWDQGLLEAVFNRSLWRPVGALEFEHHILSSDDHTSDDLRNLDGLSSSGAVVVIPARHHVHETAEINAMLAPLPWCLVILTGDEAHEFDWHELSHPRLKVWAMTPDPNIHADVDRKIASSWPPGTPDILADCEARARPLSWYFAGQVTHERRSDCVRMFEQQANGEAHPSEGFTEGLDRDEYLRRLASAKIAPCPSGPESPDTFRLWEALEAGCLPIVDGATPHGPARDFWPFLLNVDDAKYLPFPIIEDWGSVTSQYGHWLAGWPSNANRCSAWWQRYKRDVAYWLDEDVLALAFPYADTTPTPGPGWERQDIVTVVITTSPTQFHPSIDAIVETIRSVRDQRGLGDCEIIVVADGVRPEQEPYRERYEEYLRRLLWHVNHHEHNVVPIVLDAWVHQANATRAALALVRTPLMLFMEHDTPLVGSIEWDGLVARCLDGTAFVIRLYHEMTVHPDHAHLMLDVDSDDPIASIIPTIQWSQRPHLARVDFYRRMLDTYFGRDSRTMIEDVMHGVVATNYREYGRDVGWGAFRLFMYAPDPGNMKRSTHLDTRGDDPKYDMIFDYGGGPSPVGAPQPTPVATASGVDPLAARREAGRWQPDPPPAVVESDPTWLDDEYGRT